MMKKKKRCAYDFTILIITLQQYSLLFPCKIHFSNYIDEIITQSDFFFFKISQVMKFIGHDREREEDLT